MKYLLILLLVSCSHVTVETDKPVTETGPVIIDESTNDIKKTIVNIVSSHKSCSNYSWKNRGKAPLSYMNGMSLMYAKQVCNKGTGFIKTHKVSGKNTLNRPYEDGLAYYGIAGNQLNTYTFLIGLGMRESSGKYCVGRDRSQNFTKSDNAEAGLFQMAYVARVFNKELAPLYEKYKSGELSCELNTFNQSSIKCTTYDASIFGSGEGAKWQRLMKTCPAASAQWAAILIRSQLRHFGPIKRREVEFKTQCRDMLREVEAVAKNNCGAL
jgi:hypothetical protein